MSSPQKLGIDMDTPHDGQDVSELLLRLQVSNTTLPLRDEEQDNRYVNSPSASSCAPQLRLDPVGEIGDTTASTSDDLSPTTSNHTQSDLSGGSSACPTILPSADPSKNLAPIWSRSRNVSFSSNTSFAPKSPRPNMRRTAENGGVCPASSAYSLFRPPTPPLQVKESDLMRSLSSRSMQAWSNLKNTVDSVIPKSFEFKPAFHLTDTRKMRRNVQVASKKALQLRELLPTYREEGGHTSEQQAEWILELVSSTARFEAAGCELRFTEAMNLHEQNRTERARAACLGIVNDDQATTQSKIDAYSILASLTGKVAAARFLDESKVLIETDEKTQAELEDMSGLGSAVRESVIS